MWGASEDEQDFSRKRQEFGGGWDQGSGLPRLLVAKDQVLFFPSLSHSGVFAKHSKHGSVLLHCSGSF